MKIVKHGKKYWSKKNIKCPECESPRLYNTLTLSEERFEFACYDCDCRFEYDDKEDK